MNSIELSHTKFKILSASEMDNVKSEIFDLGKKLSLKEDKSERTKIKVKLVQAQLKQLESCYAGKREHNMKLTNEISELNQRLEEKNKQVEEKDKHTKKLEIRLKQKTEEQHSLGNELEGLSNQVRYYYLENESLRSQCIETAQKIIELNTRHKKDQDIIEKNNQIIESQKSVIARMTQDNDILSKVSINTEGKVKTLVNQLTQYQTKNDQLSQNNRALTGHVRKLEYQKEQLEQQNKNNHLHKTISGRVKKK